MRLLAQRLELQLAARQLARAAPPAAPRPRRRSRARPRPRRQRRRARRAAAAPRPISALEPLRRGASSSAATAATRAGQIVAPLHGRRALGLPARDAGARGRDLGQRGFELAAAPRRAPRAAPPAAAPAPRTRARSPSAAASISASRPAISSMSPAWAAARARSSSTSCRARLDPRRQLRRLRPRGGRRAAGRAAPCSTARTDRPSRAASSVDLLGHRQALGLDGRLRRLERGRLRVVAVAHLGQLVAERLLLGEVPQVALRADHSSRSLQLGLVALVALGLLRLQAQRAQPAVDLADDVGDAQQVLPRRVHAALGRLLLRPCTW